MTSPRTNVLIVGAGPVGLTAAVELRRRGVECRLVDRLTAPVRYAKAVGVQPRTLELWESAGLLGRALDAGTPMRGQLVYVNGQQVARVDLALPPEVPYRFLALPQYETERVLAERLAELGGRVERGVELVGFQQDADGVTALLRGPDGPAEVRAGYLVGCDGAHSLVRKGLGAVFAGDAFPEQYMLGDVEVDWHQPPGFGIRCTRPVNGGPDDLLVAIPLPGRRRYRMSMLVPEELATTPTSGSVEHGFEAGPVPELHHLQAVLDRLAPEPTRASNLRWSSIFKISHRIVDTYGRGRVFLAGDAAHIHPPTGAQGMNTGIQDSVALAWRLALAVRDMAAPGLLDSYDAERRPIGEEVVSRTVRHARSGFEADDPETLMLREAQLLVAYPDSTLNGEGAGVEALNGGPRPGERAPDCRELRRSAVAFPLRLHELLSGLRPALLLYADDTDQFADLAVAAAAAGRASGDHLDVVLVLAPTIPDEVADAPLDGTPTAVVWDASGEFQAAYGAVGGCCHLVRPDQHISFRAGRARAGELASHLALLITPH
ncbi:MAG TPA: FAD-dependent monooxygenase [Pseudonocardia sp.]